MKTVDERLQDQKRANIEKWGLQDHTLPEWMSIVAEEVGEAAQAANDFYFTPGRRGDMRLDSLARTKQMKHIKEELIQLAAVALQTVESLEHQTLDVTV